VTRTLTAWIRSPDPAFAILDLGDDWILRGQPDVFGWPQDAPELRWRLRLQADGAFGARCLAAAAGTVAVLADRQGE
jgi:hypothetical protein